MHRKREVSRTLPHDLVNLAVLLATDELLVLVGQLNFDPDRILGLRHKSDLGENHQSRLYRVIRTSDREGESLERDIGIRVGTNVTQHRSDIVILRKSSTIRLSDGPESAVELPDLHYN